MIEKDDSFEDVRNFAKKQRDQLRFDASKLSVAENQYVAWVDLMGAGHIMSVSIAKSANFLARLHMVAYKAVKDAPEIVHTFPINDGLFLVSKSKAAIMSVVRQVFYTLAGFFVSTPAPQDKFLLRGAIAFGPVYGGDDLKKGLSKERAARFSDAFRNIQFGPAIIQAFRQEANASPYGIAVHESARAFAPNGEMPFRETHWLWWSPLAELDWPKKFVSLRSMARCLGADLEAHFHWMKGRAIFQGVAPEKIAGWASLSKQYFSLA